MLDSAKYNLEQETLNRVDLQNQLQSLKEELNFKKNVYDKVIVMLYCTVLCYGVILVAVMVMMVMMMTMMVMVMMIIAVVMIRNVYDKVIVMLYCTVLSYSVILVAVMVMN